MMFQGNTGLRHFEPTLNRRDLLIGLGGVGLAACQPIPVTEAIPVGTWQSGPSLSVAVQEIYPTLFNGRIHLAGGFAAENGIITGPTSAHQIYDPKQNNWMLGAPLPVPRHHPHLVSFQGLLLALAGFESPSPDSAWVMQSGGWAMLPIDGRTALFPPVELIDDNWMRVPELPRPVGEAVTAVLDNTLHLAGGRRPAGEANASWQDHTDTDEHFILSSIGDAWETAAPLPTARNSSAAAIIGNDWHVVGGRTVAGGNTPAHEVYDAREDRWRTAAPMPQGQGGLAAACVEGRLYAFGGEFFNPEPGGVYAEAWCYVPANDVWVQIDDMPSPRHGLGAVAIDRDIYVLGGALGVGGRDTSALVEIFTPI
ncbi:MAG: kelch repeat-containing protein [Pseudomonadota bacterium]